MKTKDILDDNNKNNHSIEWGVSTWNQTEFSIRNRYNTSNGKFNKSGSSEIPWDDFNLMILESIERKHFSKKELASILYKIADNI